MVTLPEATDSNDPTRVRDHSGRGLTEEQRLLSGIAKTVFNLNGQLLSIAEDLARPVGLTAARWQVLATVLVEPLSVATIARLIGNTRQSVQRVADLLVEHGLAEYLPNPAHRRAKLLAPTEEGRSAVRGIRPAHAKLAQQLCEELDREGLAQILDDLTRLSSAMSEISPPEDVASADSAQTRRD